MSEETKDQSADRAPTQARNPYEFIASFAGAPTKDQIELWKSQAPGGRIRMKASSDMKRVFIMRAIGGTELAQLQGRLPQNITPERLPQELQIAVACHCCLWTSVTPDGKLTDLVLRGSGSGLPLTLHEVVSVLSDYEDPETIERLSADL
ncbi:hypothetical protein D4R30_00940 [archaeon]|nr:MAG: hypothetical protein D4R30_00940 [archaeon]